MLDNILANNILDLKDIIDEVNNCSDYLVVLCHTKFDNVNSSEVKPINSSKPVAGLCGHYIWSDYNKNYYYYETGVILQNVLNDMKYVSHSEIDVDWLYNSVVIDLQKCSAPFFSSINALMEL